MLLQIQPAIRPTRSTRRTNHQSQHAVAPSAGQCIVGFGQQVIDLVNPLRIDSAQRLAGKVAPGIQVSQTFGAGLLISRRPGEMRAQVTRQRGPATGVAGVEEEVLNVDGEKLARVAQLIAIRAARDLMIVLLARTTPPDLLRPASQIEQQRIIAQGKTPRRLPAAVIREANGPPTPLALATLALQQPLCLWPELGTVI